MIHDGIESVGNSDDGAVTKCLFDGFLYESISFHVNSCGSLIQNEDFCVSQKRSGQAH